MWREKREPSELRTLFLGCHQRERWVRIPLTHSRVVATGHSNVAETDPYVHAVGQGEALEQTRPQTLLLQVEKPRPKLGKRGRGREASTGLLLGTVPLAAPHQTESPSAQLGCSRSMALGAMKISWET